MCCFPPREEEADPNSFEVGNLLVRLCDQLPTALDTLIIATNPALEIDPYESILDSKDIKEKHVIEKGTVREGDITLLKLAGKDIIYMNLPDKDKALLDFKTHNCITKALDKAFEFTLSPKVGVSIPSYAVLNIDERLYEKKLCNAIKLFAIKGKKGVVFVEVKKSHIKEVLAGIRRKAFQEGECDEE